MAFLCSGPESGHTERRAAKLRLSRPFSFIRTLTVGFGVAPNLLTLAVEKQGARGLRPLDPYRRWGLAPRPENIGRPAGRPDRTMPKRGCASKRHFTPNPHVRHDPLRESRCLAS